MILWPNSLAIQWLSSRDFQRFLDICYLDILPLLLKRYLPNLSLGFKTRNDKEPRPDFFVGKLQEAKRPGHEGSGGDGHHQALAKGEFDSPVKSHFTVARPASLFERGTV